MVSYLLNEVGVRCVFGVGIRILLVNLMLRVVFC